jgi:hypothetical protein
MWTCEGVYEEMPSNPNESSVIIETSLHGWHCPFSFGSKFSDKPKCQDFQGEIPDPHDGHWKFPLDGGTEKVLGS